MAMKRREDDLANETVRAWGTVRPENLEKLRSGIEKGSLKAGQVRFIQTLRSDVILYGYFLHELFKSASEESSTGIDILSKVEKVEPNTLASHLPNIEDLPAIAKLTESNSFCLRFLTVAATAAAYIADRNNSDGTSAFAMVLLRNIPVCLLSWSYPSAFNKALVRFASEEQNLLSCIEDALRFKYKGYMSTFGRNYPEKLVQVCEENGFSTSGVADVKAASSKAHLFALMGEAIGRLAVPQLFPLSKAQLTEVGTTVDSYMGPHGLVKVQEKVDEMCIEYQQYSDVFSQKLRLEELGPIANDTYNRYRCNRALKGLALSERVVSMFQEFYGNMPSGEVSIESVNDLLTNVIPQLGFSHSVVYFLDLGSGRLIPKIKKGAPEDSVDRSILLSESQIMQIVQTAIDAPAPITREQRYGTKKTYSYIAAKFGSKAMSGVFFVQGGENLEGVSASDRTTRFQAGRRALCDALNLPH